MKDTYYFPHDSNAKRDPKMMLLRHQLGPQGYGVYWMLIEDLREQENYKLPVNIIPALASEYNISEQILKAIITSFDLFEIEDDKYFYSPSLIRRMEKWDTKREFYKKRAEKAAQKRWEKLKENNAKALQEDYNNNTKEMQKQCLSNAKALQEDCNSNANNMQSDAIRLDKIRLDKIRLDKNKHIYKGCVDDLMEYYSFTEINNFDKYRDATIFINLLASNGQLDYFLKQFNAYKEYKKLSGEKKHSFRGFIGTIENKFMDGGWNSRNWEEELKDIRKENTGESIEKSVKEMMKQVQI